MSKQKYYCYCRQITTGDPQLVLARDASEAALEYAKDIWSENPPEYPEGEEIDIEVARKDEPIRVFTVSVVNEPKYTIEETGGYLKETNQEEN